MQRTPDRRGRSVWPYLSLIPIGFGAWAPIYAGVRARVTSWVWWGALWTAIAILGWVLNGTSSHPGSDDLAGACLLLGWVGAAVTSFLIRGRYDTVMDSPLHEAAESARERLDERARARRLAHDQPALAREMGLGRPDQPGGETSGLVDINNAGVTAIASLPGIDDALATWIVETRASLGPFSSLEDMGTVLDLDGALVERLRDRCLFLARD